MAAGRPGGDGPNRSRRRTFARTWWGGAWIDALEQRARLDPNRLPRGRTYARQDRVGALSIGPGFVEAPVRGSRPRPYVVTVRVRPFTVAEWDRVIDAIAGRAAHAAALLDGELPAAVLADAQEAGVELLPDAGEVQPRCTCPDWAEPCKHAAAVCYLVADELDRDPFELLHLRGRTRSEVLDGLRQRRRTGGSGREAAAPAGARARTAAPGAGPATRSPAGADAGPAVAAREAFARPQPDAATLLALGAGRPAAAPGRSAPLAVEPPAGGGLDRAALTALADDAAERAWRLLRGEGDGDLALAADADLVRRAATPSDPAALDALADRAGVKVPELARGARAWRLGGEEAWRVTAESWSPARHPHLGAAVHDARRALAAAPGVTGRLTTVQNRVTRGPIQLRLAPSGRWWRFAKVAGSWQAVSGPAEDPATLL
jgi:uncharacterized Zn finger protein